jgi:hypothetical protein
MTAIAMIDLPGTRTNRQTPRDLVCTLAVQIIGQRRKNLFVASDDSYNDVRSYREAVGRHGQEFGRPDCWYAAHAATVFARSEWH